MLSSHNRWLWVAILLGTGVLMSAVADALAWPTTAGGVVLAFFVALAVGTLLRVGGRGQPK